MNEHILVVDDEPDVGILFVKILSRDGYTVTSVANYRDALLAVARKRFDVIYADIRLGGHNGLDLLKELHRQGADMLVIIMTASPDLASAQEALRHGAFDYLAKPILADTLRRSTQKALEHKALRDEKEKYRRNLEAIFRSVGDAIITVDHVGRMLEMNQQSQQLCGFHREMIGHPLHLHPAGCGRRCLSLLEWVLRHGVESRQEQMICQPTEARRQEQVVAIHASPLRDEGGRFYGAVMVVRDETRVAALERDLKERRKFHGIIGHSPVMQNIYTLAEDLASVETTVLVTGESGTGKELVADAIHHQGNRAGGPLVKVNCAALPETLLESELFGHVRGAFTGALRDKMGRFQMADKGTLFLDEIGDISPGLQTRLLRVLQEKSFERVGDHRTLRVDVRVIAATNQNLREKIAQGEFREDLYYRLKVVELHLPPLRERRSDIPLLCEHFIDRFNRKFNKNIRGLSDRVLRAFMNFRWPGNIRELEHVLEHAFVVCRKSWIDLDDLPPEYRVPIHAGVAVTDPGDEEARERERMLDALRKAGGVKSRAARLLGVSRSTMYRKLRELHISDQEEDPHDSPS